LSEGSLLASNKHCSFSEAFVNYGNEKNKKFIPLALGPNVIKLSMAVIYESS
jgi:hypothetical protein